MKKLNLLIAFALTAFSFLGTNAQQISSFPYLEEFESGNGGWSAAGSNSSWDRGIPSGSFISETAGCGDTAWVTNLSGDYNSSENSQLTSPMFDFTALTSDPTIRFDHIYETESCCDEGWVEISLNGGSTWSKLGTASSGGSNWYNDASNNWWDGTSGSANEWRTASHPLTGAAGEDSVMVRFVLSTDGSVQRDGFAYDNIAIFERYTDPQMAGIAEPAGAAAPFSATENVSAIIANSGTDTITSIQLGFVLDGGLTNSETFSSLSILPNAVDTLTFTNTADLSVLGPHTIDLFIQSVNDYICNDSAEFSFTTTQIVNTFPYVEYFEDNDGGWIATGSNASWAHGVPASGAFIDTTVGCGNQAWVTNLTGDYNNSEDSYVESPVINFSSLSSDPVLQFSHIYETESCCDEGWVETSTDGGATWTKLGTTTSGGTNWYNDASNNWWDGNSGAANVWRTASHPLTGLAGQSNVKIRFAFDSDGSVTRDGFAIDNIFIFESLTDPALAELVQPDSTVFRSNSSAAISLDVSIANLGSDTVNSIQLCYVLDGGTANCETFTPGTLPSALDTLTFTQTIDLSTVGSHDLDLYIGSANDNGCNDSLSFAFTTVACQAPTALNSFNITNTSADVSWTENNSATSWQIEYGISGFTQGNGTFTVVTNDTATLSSLTTYQEYDFYVRSICGIGDTSNWSTGSTFLVGLPLAGTYTIDSSLSAGASNFLSFSDFATIANDVGVSATVTVNVAAGEYNDQMSLGKINGTSAINTITIDGNDEASIVHDKSSRNSTITIEGTSYLTIKNLTIETTGTLDAWGVHVFDSAHHITIDSNEILMPIGSNSDVAGIIASNSETSDASSGDNAFNLTISNNYIIGGERGMSIYGSFTASARNQNLTVHNNESYHAADNGFYITGQNNISITDNKADSLINSFADACYVSDLENFTISGNYFNAGDNGFDADDLNFDNTVSTKSEISNNMFIGGDDAFYLDDVEETEIFHNSTYAEDYGIYINDDVNIDVRNNIFVSNTDYAFYSADASTTMTLDYNIYNSSGTNLAYYGGSVYADLAAFQVGQATLNSNSLEGDPIYFSTQNDLHIAGTLANDVGDNSVGITVDFDGDTRPLAPSTTVDIGADEFAPPSCGRPFNLRTDSISSDDAYISWNTSGNDTAWVVIIDTTGFNFDPMTGNFAGARFGDQVADTAGRLGGGLLPNTSYDWYVRGICAAGDTSDWVGPMTFTTLCNAFNAPYLMNFDNGAAGDFNNAGIDCWTAIGPGANDIDISTSTDQGATIPTLPNTVELNDGTWPTDSAILVSPPFADLSTGNNRIRFQAAFESTTATNVSMFVGVMTDPFNSSTFTPIDTIDASDVGSTTNFGEIIIDLDQVGLIGTSQFIAIAHGPGAFEAYIDSFIYEPIPTPYYPIATINTEDANGVADSLNVECWTSGTVLGVDLDGNNGISFTISDLSTGMQEGINVFNFNDVSNYVVNEGDSIMVRGTVGQFRGLTQISPDSIILIDTNATLPMTMMVDSLGEYTESKYVELISDFVLLNGSGPFSFNMDATNGTDTITIRVDSDTDINDSLSANPLVPGDTICGLTGIGGQFDSSNPFTSGYQVFPMRYSDLSICRFVPPAVTPYYPIGTINTEDANGVADSLNVLCFTSGTVIGVDLDGNNGISFFISDLSSGSQQGINVFNFNDVSNYVVNEGDSILVRGTIIQFNGLTEINPDSISIIKTNATLPMPRVVTDIVESNEGEWLSLDSLRIIAVNPTGSSGTNYDATTTSGDTITMRVDNDTDIDDSTSFAVNDLLCNVLAVGSQFDNSSPYTSGYQIFPMRFSDIDTVSCQTTGINELSATKQDFVIYPNPSTGEFVLSTTGFNNPTVKIEVRDMSGRIVKSELINNANQSFARPYQMNNDVKGIYFISVLDGDQAIHKKLVIQ